MNEIKILVNISLNNSFMFICNLMILIINLNKYTLQHYTVIQCYAHTIQCFNLLNFIKISY